MFSGDGVRSRQTRAAMKTLATLALAAALLAAAQVSAQPAKPSTTGLPVRVPQVLPVPGWSSALQTALERVDARHPGDFGVYVRHLDRDESFSYRAEEPWYLASGIKVPVAIAVMRAVAGGALSLDTRVTLREDDYVDGAGGTNAFKPGARLRVAWLLEQMIVHSDNTASDVLIRTAGIDRVNAVAAELSGAADLRITTLADVRRLAYGQLHPAASRLGAADLLAIRASGAGPARVRTFAQRLSLAPAQLRLDSLDAAFEAYYASHVNSASLVDFGRMLAALSDGRALPPRETVYLLDLMARVQTGHRRLRAGLPPGTRFEHKTGTQHRRTCDLGIATLPAAAPGAAPARVVIAACTRGTGTAAGERALRDVAAAITASGVFRQAPPRPTVSPTPPA